VLNYRYFYHALKRIEASQDGSPYVYVTFSDPDYKPGDLRLEREEGM
jgi:hypothetical protein